MAFLYLCDTTVRVRREYLFLISKVINDFRAKTEMKCLISMLEIRTYLASVDRANRKPHIGVRTFQILMSPFLTSKIRTLFLRALSYFFRISGQYPCFVHMLCFHDNFVSIFIAPIKCSKKQSAFDSIALDEMRLSGTISIPNHHTKSKLGGIGQFRETL